jgi:conjugal transfer ATP-binding protein TraC
MGFAEILREAFLPERHAEADRLPRHLLQEISRMPRLSGILPYLAWQDDTRLFALDQGGFGERQEHAIGFCIETLPQTGANDEMEKVLASLRLIPMTRVFSVGTATSSACWHAAGSITT